MGWLPWLVNGSRVIQRPVVWRLGAVSGCAWQSGKAGKRKLGVEHLGRARKSLENMFEDENENENEDDGDVRPDDSVEERRKPLSRNRVE